jgi:glycosyltransferase-like protein
MSESPLTIGLLTHSVNPRGGVVHSLSLAEALTDQGHRVTLFAPALPGEQLFRTARCEIVLVPVERPARDLVSLVEMRIDAYVSHLDALLRTRDFDILHAQDSISGNALATLRNMRRINHYARTVHHLDEFDDPRLSTYQLRAFAGADRVMCVSRMWCEHLRNTHGIEAVQICNGVDTTRFNPRIGPRDSEVATRYGIGDGVGVGVGASAGRSRSGNGGPIVVSVGGIEARKNTVRLLEGFIEFRKAHPLAQLVVAGGASLLDHDEYGHAFQAVAAGLGRNVTTEISGRVPRVAPGWIRGGAQHDRMADGVFSDVPSGGPLKILGKIPDEDMPSLLRLADVVAMPSIREGFGLVALEAIACGTPALVSRIAPFTEHLGEADCVFVDPFDPASIAAGLETALTHRTDPLSIPSRFSWSASADHHANLYRTMLTQPELN